jgi:hypothetical protein
MAGGGFVEPPPLRVTGPAPPIASIWSWFAAAPPKGAERHWVDGRSAKELAQAWCRGPRPAPPPELLGALDAHPDTAGFTAWDVLAEHVTTFDDAGGEGRNHDLVVVGTAHGGPTLLGVEAKAGERFGDTSVADQLAAGLAKTGSKIPRRVQLLCNALGSSCEPALAAGLAHRGYQLLTATIGTVVEAGRRHCRQAIVVVHEFRPLEPAPKLLAELNAAQTDLDAFVAYLSQGEHLRLYPGQTIGPFALTPTRFVPDGIRLYLAKVRTDLPATMGP